MMMINVHRFSETNVTSYRPTNEDCLMRIVTSPNFCSVCLERLWLSLAQRVNLVDVVRMGCKWVDESSDPSSSSSSAGHWNTTIDLGLVPFAQFNEDETLGAEESYAITWIKDGKVLTQFANQTRLELDDAEASGLYMIYVRLSTPKVRVDIEGALTGHVKWFIRRTCSG